MESIYTGSIAKGTAVSISTDADVFISLSSTTPDTLAQIYDSLHNTLAASGFSPRKQNVSIGISSLGFKIDLVPGKRQSQYGYDHSLYKHKTGGWTKTNVKTHVSQISSSNRQREIKLAKIWRELNGLEFPSFYLELATISCLTGCSYTGLSTNFWRLLGFFANEFPSKRYVDPANTNNVVSDDLSYQQKAAIKRAASVARTQQNWSGIVW